jgi:hypothetical protein
MELDKQTLKGTFEGAFEATAIGLPLTDTGIFDGTAELHIIRDDPSHDPRRGELTLTTQVKSNTAFVPFSRPHEARRYHGFVDDPSRNREVLPLADLVSRSHGQSASTSIAKAPSRQHRGRAIRCRWHRHGVRHGPSPGMHCSIGHRVSGAGRGYAPESPAYRRSPTSSAATTSASMAARLGTTRLPVIS